MGEEWAYRSRTAAPSQRVRVLAIERRKATTRVSIQILDGDRVGTVEDVPAGRLRCLWSEVAQYDALMANWERLKGYELTSAEETAAWTVADLLIPEGIVTIDEGNVRNCAGVDDVAGLEQLTGKPASDFIDAVPSFQDGDTWWLSAEGAIRISELSAVRIPCRFWTG